MKIYEVRNELGMGDVVATFFDREDAVKYCDIYKKDDCLIWENEIDVVNEN